MRVRGPITRTPVSLIMSTWNQADKLPQVLDSIFAQNYEPLEVIVIDDGSTDNTQEICAKYPVRYLYNHKVGWGGAGPSINLGIKMSSYDIVILQCADIVHTSPHTIQQLVDTVAPDEQNWALAECVREDGPGICPKDNFFNVLNLSALWKKHLIAIRGVDEDYVQGWGEDGDLSERLLLCGLKQFHLSPPLARHLYHLSSYQDGQGGVIDQRIKDCYLRKTQQMKEGTLTIVRNPDHWGIRRLPTLSVIIPTHGRPTLAASLLAVTHQLLPNDEVIVIGDGPVPLAKHLVGLMNDLVPNGPSIRYFDGPITKRTGGYEQKVEGFRHATKNLLVLLNDDDSPAPNAMKIIRRAALKNPNRPLGFLMIDVATNIIYGQKHEVVFGKISDVQLVVPNNPNKLGSFAQERDDSYWEEILAHYPDGIAWTDKIIYDWNTFDNVRNKELPPPVFTEKERQANARDIPEMPPHIRSQLEWLSFGN